MQIILLDEARFDQFAVSHPNHNYYQTSNYGRLMTKHGHNAYYLGLAADDGEIKAATLIIVKNDSKEKRKMGYRGEIPFGQTRSFFPLGQAVDGTASTAEEAPPPC